MKHGVFVLFSLDFLVYIDFYFPIKYHSKDHMQYFRSPESRGTRETPTWLFLSRIVPWTVHFSASPFHSYTLSASEVLRSPHLQSFLWIQKMYLLDNLLDNFTK